VSPLDPILALFHSAIAIIGQDGTRARSVACATLLHHIERLLLVNAFRIIDGWKDERKRKDGIAALGGWVTVLPRQGAKSEPRNVVGLCCALL
jgi:hypothetical protein